MMFVLNGVDINFLCMRKYTPIHDQWQEAMNVWRYDAWAANLQMSRATFMFIVEQLTPTLAKESRRSCS